MDWRCGSSIHKGHEYKTGPVSGVGTSGRGEGEQRGRRRVNLVGVLYILV
jgi:hypothetical protein